MEAEARNRAWFFSGMITLAKSMSGGASKRSIGINPSESICTVISSDILFSRDCKNGRVKLTKKRNSVHITCLSRDLHWSMFRFNDTPLYDKTPKHYNLPFSCEGRNPLVSLRITGER